MNENIHGAIMSFHGVLQMFLKFLPRTKRFEVLIEKFYVFHKVLVYYLMVDGYR